MLLWKNVEELTDLKNDFLRFKLALSELAETLGLDLTRLEADHLAVRCHQNSTAERWKKGLLQVGELFSEKRINGRPICLFTLNQPLVIGPWQISVIELPWPGEKRYRHQGWEHVEIVLPGDAESLTSRALALISDEGLSRRDIAVKIGSPKAVDEILPNPTLAVSDGITTIKFHLWRLQDIVASDSLVKAG